MCKSRPPLPSPAGRVHLCAALVTKVVCSTFVNECSQPYSLAISAQDGDHYTSRGWWTIKARAQTDICWDVTAPTADAAHDVSMHFASSNASYISLLKPHNLEPWSGGLAESRFCTDDITSFSITNDGQSCDKAPDTQGKGHNKRLAQFWRTRHQPTYTLACSSGNGDLYVSECAVRGARWGATARVGCCARQTMTHSR